MEFCGLPLLSVLIVCSLNVVSGHECLDFKPMDNFEMKRFMGIWYAVVTSSPQNRCLVFEFDTQKHRNLLNPMSPPDSEITNCKDCQYCVNLLEPIAKQDVHFPYVYNYVGALEADPSLPSKMTVSSIMNVPKEYSMSFVVFDTDYENFAGIYSCRKSLDVYQHSVTILSRSEYLDKEKLDNLNKLIDAAYKRPDGGKLSIVDHKDCNYTYEKFNGSSNDQRVIDEDGKFYFSVNFITDEKITPVCPKAD